MSKDRRKENNDRVLERMKNPNDTLNVIGISKTWYPPRPIIKKIKGALIFEAISPTGGSVAITFTPKRSLQAWKDDLECDLCHELVETKGATGDAQPK